MQLFLCSMHQTHYEQFGEMSGTVTVEGHGEFDIKVQGVRDHSYGNRSLICSMHLFMFIYNRRCQQGSEHTAAKHRRVFQSGFPWGEAYSAEVVDHSRCQGDGPEDVPW